MRRICHFVLFVLLAVGGGAHAADVIDRIVATVNGHVILQSDWEDAVRFEAFVEGRPLSHVTDQDRSRALDRLIDQELLREQPQGADTQQPSANEVKKRIQEIQTQQAATQPNWSAALAGYGFDEKQFEARIAHDLSVLRQVEARLLPSVQIDAQSIQSYYREKFLPQLHSAGAQDVPLAEVSARIREILTQEKVNQLFTSWLQSLRAESKIRTAVAASSPPAAGGQGSE